MRLTTNKKLLVLIAVFVFLTFIMPQFIVKASAAPETYGAYAANDVEFIHDLIDSGYLDWSKDLGDGINVASWPMGNLTGEVGVQWESEDASSSLRITVLNISSLEIEGSLDARPLSKLEKLNVSKNKLTDLNLTGISQINYLNCGDNRFSSRASILGVDESAWNLEGFSFGAQLLPPNPVALSETYRTVKITWPRIDYATHYQVYRANSQGGPYTKIGNPTTNLSFINNANLVIGQTYYYKVRALLIAGDDVQSSGDSAVTSATVILPAPKTTKLISSSYRTNTLTWKKVYGATHYQVYRATSRDGSYVKIGQPTEKLSFINNFNIVVGRQYFYKVRALRIEDEQVYSSADSSMRYVLSRIPAPKNVKARAYTSTSIKITWSKVPGATKYRIYRATSKNGTYKKVVDTSKLSYVNSKLKKGKRYYYRVKSLHLVGGKNIPSKFSGYSSDYPKINKLWLKQPTAVYVSLKERKVYLYKNGKLVKTYRAAVGKAGYSTPRGNFKINLKRYRPVWYNPGGSWAKNMPARIGPSASNPLGLRALNLNVGLIRIHGTSNTGSLGRAASHGCVRLSNSSIVDLYKRVKLGTPVYIRNLKY